MTSSDTGSAPELMRLESCFAESTVKLPWMMPLPEVNTTWMVGAEICCASSVIWTGWLR